MRVVTTKTSTYRSPLPVLKKTLDLTQKSKRTMREMAPIGVGERDKKVSVKHKQCQTLKKQKQMQK